MSSDVPVYYCLECGYSGATAGICPECHKPLVADDTPLPSEKEEKYDEDLLEDAEEEEKIPPEEIE